MNMPNKFHTKIRWAACLLRNDGPDSCACARPGATRRAAAASGRAAEQTSGAMIKKESKLVRRFRGDGQKGQLCPDLKQNDFKVFEDSKNNKSLLFPPAADVAIRPTSAPLP